MPELPEVEAARRSVQEHCAGGLIIRAVVAEDSKVVEGVEPFVLQRTLVAKRIIAAHRKGKQLWLELDEPPSPVFQFGMAGAVYIKGVQVTKYVRSAVKDEDEWPSKYSKVFLELDTGVTMSFTDKRRFARIRLLDNPAASSPISELGPDALDELPDETTFAKSIVKRKMPIKALLLDQSFLAGIGNWIADEVLYQARIHPEQPASSLSVDLCKRLRDCIEEVIKSAVDVDADSTKYPNSWIFHNREKKANAFVDGKKIEFITVGGRTSAYVPELQILTGENVPKKRISRKKATEEGEKKNSDEDEKGKDETISRGKAEPKVKRTKKAVAQSDDKEKTTTKTRQSNNKVGTSSDLNVSAEEDDVDGDVNIKAEAPRQTRAAAAKSLKDKAASSVVSEEEAPPNKKRRGKT